MSASFRNMDTSLEEAALTAGSSTFTTLTRVTLPLMRPARVAMGETWDQAMNVLERTESAGRQMVDDIRDGRKKSVDAVDHAVLTHERIVVMNEAAMEAERASDLHMTEQERNEARARWGVLEDRLNEVDQALRQAGTISGRALQFRKALIRDDYTLTGSRARLARLRGAADPGGIRRHQESSGRHQASGRSGSDAPDKGERKGRYQAGQG
jgi:hypothetical protein